MLKKHGMQSTKSSRCIDSQKSCQDFGKKFKDSDEKDMRFKAFSENYDYIVTENAKKEHSYTLGLNDFSDWTAEEFEKGKLGMQLPKHKPTPRAMHKVRNISLPSSVDWRSKGVVTPVKNQELGSLVWPCSISGKGLVLGYVDDS